MLTRTTARRLAVGTALLVQLALLQGIPALGAQRYAPPKPQLEKPVPGSAARPRQAPALAPARQYAPAAPVWPAAGVAEVAAGRAGSLPVSVDQTSAGRVRVELTDRATAARTGSALLMRVSRAGAGTGARGMVRLRVDYSGFAAAYGADWADRLRLVALPECALRTPERAGCQGTALPSKNDGSSVTAPVNLPTTTSLASATASSTLVALTAGTSSGSGDYAATPLTASSTWAGGGSSGDFTWSYPLRTPPGLGGPTPAVALAYSSQSVDGRMAASNNQPSWVGEGFEYSPGFIERRYGSCADDRGGTANNGTASGDQCWKTDNATLSLNGAGGELIYNASEQLWHPRTDDSSNVERKTGAVNGDNDGEYWIVTTPDGTRYYFGLNRLAGWTAGKPETNSAFTVPVHGNHPGEPCHATSFAASSCAQVWRWNLDYVVDPHGNTMSYWYAKESNSYGRNNSTTDLASYTRGGHLQRIDYGTDQRTLVGGVATDTVYTATAAPAQVVFGAADRCLSSCTIHDAVRWPDVPWDQECGTSPCTTNAPTFWTTKRLASIRTKAWSGVAYRDVESWTLSHSFPDPGDGTRAGLWLDRISHTGLVGGSLSVPDVVFAGIPMPNRVDTALINGLKPMNWRRVKTITTETGAVIDVTYSPADCVAGSRMPAAAESNTLRCYPVRWTPPDPGTEITDWFHKYVVSQVVENDMTSPAAGSPLTVTTAYEYAGTPAWHYTDDDGLTKDKYRTWSSWRGYGLVRVRKGTGTERTYTETRFFRGMDGDHLPSGIRSATVTDSKNLATVADADAYAGKVRETVTYNGPGGAAIGGTITDPRQSNPTATRTINGVTVAARHVGASGTHTWVARDGGRTDRWSRTATEVDSLGMPTAVTDFGDNSVSGDEQCALTDYARNTQAWLVKYQSRIRSYALTCAEATQPGRVFTADDILGEVRTSYDNQAWGTAPGKGDATKVEQLKDWPAGSFVTTSRAAFDAYGRPIDAWDAANNHTGTAYTPASGGPVTRITTTNPLGWTSITELEPAWGLTTASIDANNRRGDLAYDPLGRLTGVWPPGRNKTTQTASTAYTYALSNTVPSVVATAKLNPAGGYVTTYAIYDALLRLRQTQAPEAGTGGGRVVTDTFYDTAGRPYQGYGPYYALGAASGTLFLPATGHDDIPSWTRTVFDGAGRPTAAIEFSRLAERWRTTTVYGGDRTDVTPPTGGTVTSTVVDAHGHTVELRQYHGAAATGAYDETGYRYNRKGQLDRITGPDGARWEYRYDLRGRTIGVTDPDKGNVITGYDDAGRVVSTTDARGTTLAYSYDALGRKTGIYLGSTSGTQLAGWGYDGVVNTSGVSISRGLLTSSTRYVGGNAYVQAVTALDGAGRPIQRKITIPGNEAGLAGTYTYGTTYRVDGSPATTTLPAIGGAGGLPAETLTTGYHTLGLPATLSTSIGATSYVSATSFTQFAEASDTTLRNAGGKVVDVVRSYEEGTHRLSRVWLTRETNPATLSDLSYRYDPAGNITRTVESSTVAGRDTQCYTYDSRRRLTEAWTPASGDCAAAPAAGALGGPAPYWTTWTFDAGGNRRSQTEHATANGDRTTTYTYPAATGSQPHTLTGTSITDATGTRTASYGYNAAGDMTSRPAPGGGSQTLTWDSEGHLASLTDTSGTTSYVYDADGNRLIRRSPTGTTLYLPGQELRVTTSGQVISCVRYYSHRGQTIAMRTPASLTWLLSDPQGTGQISLDAVTQSAMYRRQTPYGEPRGTAPTWPNDKGFVGGTRDDTGLTHLGAREYDPTIGRFISADPVVDTADPQQMQGYSYAGNNPVVYSDPSGLRHFQDDTSPWVSSAEQLRNIAHCVTESCVRACRYTGGRAPVVSPTDWSLGDWTKGTKNLPPRDKDADSPAQPDPDALLKDPKVRKFIEDNNPDYIVLEFVKVRTFRASVNMRVEVTEQVDSKHVLVCGTANGDVLIQVCTIRQTTTRYMEYSESVEKKVATTKGWVLKRDGTLCAFVGTVTGAKEDSESLRAGYVVVPAERNKEATTEFGAGWSTSRAGETAGYSYSFTTGEMSFEWGYTSEKGNGSSTSVTTMTVVAQNERWSW
ncbi:MAG TPA: RHS repeat-associated core domain-containing protein [Pilimelia sp.]|nr:RHS repeat-associated core domain-containing protein [Pilimelia sp.]